MESKIGGPAILKLSGNLSPQTNSLDFYQGKGKDSGSWKEAVVESERLGKAKQERLPKISLPNKAITKRKDQVHDITGQEVKRRREMEVGQDRSCTEPAPTENSVTKSLHNGCSSRTTSLRHTSLFPTGRSVPPPIGSRLTCAGTVVHQASL